MAKGKDKGRSNEKKKPQKSIKEKRKAKKDKASKNNWREHECGEQMFMPSVNSPRMGICGYCGQSDYDFFYGEHNKNKWKTHANHVRCSNRKQSPAPWYFINWGQRKTFCSIKNTFFVFLATIIFYLDFEHIFRILLLAFCENIQTWFILFDTIKITATVKLSSNGH